MSRLRKWLDWPLTPFVFPRLLELPEGKPRRIALAALRQNRKVTLTRALFFSLLWLIQLTLLMLLELVPFDILEEYKTFLWSSVWVSMGVCIVGMLIGPIVLNIKTLRNELGRLIDTGELWKCEKCSYALCGNTSGICPECGTPIPKELRSMVRQNGEESESSEVS